MPAAWPTALHMLAHMLNGDLPDARHAHRRLAAETAAAGPRPLSDQAAATRALRRMWPGDGGPATASAGGGGGAGGGEADQADTAFAALDGHGWPEGPTAAVAAALARRLRAEALGAVAWCYARLPLREAALLLGFGADEAAAAAAARAAGWGVSDGGGAGAAAAVVEPRAAEGAAPQLDAMGALVRLTEYMGHLEGDGFGGLLGKSGAPASAPAAAAAAAAAAGGGEQGW